jgi:hypothetical protein
MQNFDYDIGFYEKRQFFSPKNCQKSQKIMIITSTLGKSIGDKKIKK